MTADLRRLIDRPLGTRRFGAFAGVACVLLLVAGGLAFTAAHRPTSVDDIASGRPATDGRTGQAAAGVVVAPTLDTDPAAAGPLEGDRAAVVRQSRRFLTGYLPYLYGQGEARSIRASTGALRRRLESARLRVSPASRKRRPRVVRLAPEPLGRRGRWHVVATVADGGVAEYPIELLVSPSSRGFVVEAVVSE